jgi:hypothetical protein
MKKAANWGGLSRRRRRIMDRLVGWPKARFAWTAVNARVK